MLHERWLETLNACAGRIAIAGPRGGVTFAELGRLAESGPRCSRGEIVAVSAAGGMAEFAAGVIRCWRDGAVLVPCESQPPDLSPHRGLPPGIAHVKLTSGSTGEPRFVLFREEQLLADLDHIWETMGFDAGSRNLAVISPAHSYGFSHLVLPLLLRGMPLHEAADPLPGTMRECLRSTGPDYFLPAVPAMWRAWHLAGVLKNAPITRAMSAGAPLPLELEREIFTGAGLKVHNFLGASECGGIAYDRGEIPREDAAFVGEPLRGVAVETADDGCLLVRSAAAGECYWPPAAGRGEMLGGGVFKTSDIAEITDGKVRLLGRRSDAIHVAGRKVSPAEVEAAILACPQVRHCVVFGVPSRDAARQEEVAACVSAAGGIGEPELAAMAGERLAPWQMPRHWWLNDELQADERGKTPRSVWRQRFLDRPLPRP